MWAAREACRPCPSGFLDALETGYSWRESITQMSFDAPIPARPARPRQRYVVGGLILKRANSPPRITARRGGGVTKKMARSLLMDAAGVVFLVPSIGTPPRPREKRMLRDIFLIARPPLLVVMRGGEFAILKIVPSLDIVPLRCAIIGSRQEVLDASPRYDRRQP